MKTSVGFAAAVNSLNKLVLFSRYFAIALLMIFLSGLMPSRANAQAESNWEPEIVRLSYVQGDVRLSRGGKNGADLNTSWEIAQTNVPMEQGFSVATGTGRAEVEFENGTILYLAENSVLEFNRLEDSFGVPITDIELVTGTATVNVRPAPRELFVISTPSERLSFPAAALVRIDSFLDGVTATPENDKGDDVIEYGAAAAPHAGTRITMNFNDIQSTVKLPAGLANGISDLAARNASNKTHLNAGQPITYQNSKRVTDGTAANNSGAPADWDAWVLARVTKRDHEISAALKASGLVVPVPGLIDMYESGTFFPCEPDGKCWQPNGVSGSDGVIDLGDGSVLADGTMPPDGSNITSLDETSAGLIASLGAPIFPAPGFHPLQSQSSQQSTEQQNKAQQPLPGTIIVGGPQTPKITVYRVRLDECSDEVRRQEVTTDPVTGKRIILNETIEHDPWMWGVCNSGGWIPFRGRYQFVAGRAQHHRVHYMHIGNKNCWVPRNPHDKRGQTPLNLKNGAFAAGKKAGSPPQFVKWNPSDKVKLLTTTPKEFRAPTEKTGRMPAQRPDIHARLVTRGTINTARTQPGAKATQISATKNNERTISYNYHSKTFERPGAVPVSGRNSAAKPEVVGHFNANGQFNSGSHENSRGNGGTTAGGRTSSGGGSGGYSGGGHSGSGNSGGHSSGGSSGGGGGHSGGGGGSSGGGGGGHSGGGSSGGGGGHGH